MSQTQPIKIDANTSAVMDVLRGSSAIVVAAVHAFQIFLIPYFGIGSPSHLLTSLAATYAVIVFFVVSGFMICVSVSRHRNDDGTFRSQAFAEARVLRIYPPLIAAIFVTMLAYLMISGFGLHGSESYRLGGELDVVREKATFEWHALPSTFFLLYGAVPSWVPGVHTTLLMDGSLWTLPYEWWFYVLTFLSARLLNGFRFATIAPLLAVVLMLIVGRNLLFMWFLLIWLSGYALGFAYLNGLLRSRFFWPVVTALSISVVGSIIWTGRGNLLHDILNPFLAQSSMTRVGILITLAVAATIRTVEFKSRPRIARTARFSYTLYVIHYPLLLLAYSLLHPITHGHHWTVTAIAAMLSALLIARVSSNLARIVENRALILKARNLLYSRVPQKEANYG